MEILIKDFVKVERGSGYDYGSGSGYGYDYGSGSGNGYGIGSGGGNGNGSGGGNGNGSKNIKIFNDMQVDTIDDIPTIITNIKGNIAKGHILNQDFTLLPCFVIKENNLFAHGETLHKAREGLMKKIFDTLNVEEKIKIFLKEFKPNEKYKGTIFYGWHNKLTGSCEMGRKHFIENNDLSLDDEYTVDEFLELTTNAYGSEIINKLIEKWKGNR